MALEFLRQAAMLVPGDLVAILGIRGLGHLGVQLRLEADLRQSDRSTDRIGE